LRETVKGRGRVAHQGSIVPAEVSPASDPIAGAPLDSGALYRAHVARVTRWVRRLAGPHLDVEDVVQDVFARVHQLLPQFRGEAAITTWLYRITENLVISRRRRERVRRWLLGRPDRIEEPPAFPTPLEVLEQRDAERLIYCALDGVPERYRSVFIWFELEGMSGEQIATLTGCRLATVWVRLHRARERFFAQARRLRLAEAVR
jgi:RNA polymerase sigma-70 factor (ECF subfamily)